MWPVMGTADPHNGLHPPTHVSVIISSLLSAAQLSATAVSLQQQLQLQLIAESFLRSQ
jgi:hypothetical protein